jgi:hypothetical protein
MTEVSVVGPADGEVFRLGPTQIEAMSRYATVPATDFSQ